jgi:hypothetical protein
MQSVRDCRCGRWSLRVPVSGQMPCLPTRLAPYPTLPGFLCLLP